MGDTIAPVEYRRPSIRSTVHDILFRQQPGFVVAAEVINNSCSNTEDGNFSEEDPDTKLFMEEAVENLNHISTQCQERSKESKKGSKNKSTKNHSQVSSRSSLEIFTPEEVA